MESLITSAYYFAMFIMAASYLPQIVTLIKDETGAKAINLFTAFMWSLATILFSLYAIFLNQDILIIFYGAINSAGCAGILFLALYNRFVKSQHWDAE